VSDSNHPAAGSARPVATPAERPLLSRLAIPSRERFVFLGELTRELVARDLKLRYKRTLLGVAWSLANPLSQWLVLGFVFRYVIDVRIDRYLSFLFTGILAWSWLHSALVACATSVVDNASLLRRPGFPAPILPLVAVTTQTVQFLFSLPILLVAAAWDGDPYTWALLALPVVMALQFVLTLGVGYLVATLHVAYRDTRYLLDVALMLAFYLTPVFYDGASVPPPFDRLFRLNPVLHLLEAYRAVVVAGKFPAVSTLALLAAVAAGIFALGYGVFRRRRHDFAEEL
jgi:lipopolysaccharide transport system permease protein